MTLDAVDIVAALSGYQELFNVRDYGAVGDGETNDVVAIQKAIDQAGVNGGLVFFPSGTYIISTTLTIANNSVSVAGASRETVTIKNQSNNNPSALIRVGQRTPALNVTDVTIRDITFDGQSGTITTASDVYNGLDLASVDRVRVYNCTVQEIGQNGIAVGGGAAVGPHNDIVVDGCTLTDIGLLGISFVDVGRSHINNNTVISTGQSAIALSGTDSFITNNYANRATVPTHLSASLSGTEIGFLISIIGADKTVVANNILIDNRNASADGIGSGATTTRSMIVGNYVKFAGLYGIDVEDFTTCTGNVIENADAYGIFCGADAGQDRDHVVIANNVIVDPNERQAASQFAGIVIVSNIAGAVFSDIVITGNTVSDRRGGANDVRNGIRIDTTNLTLNDCTIDGNTFSGVQVADLEITGTAVNRLVIGSGNKFTVDHLSGVATLSSGVVNITPVGLPADLDMLVEHHRVDINSSTVLGVLSGDYLASSPRVELRSWTPGDASAETNDVSMVYWRIAGTNDAFE